MIQPLLVWSVWACASPIAESSTGECAHKSLLYMTMFISPNKYIRWNGLKQSSILNLWCSEKEEMQVLYEALLYKVIGWWCTHWFPLPHHSFHIVRTFHPFCQCVIFRISCVYFGLTDFISNVRAGWLASNVHYKINNDNLTESISASNFHAS